MVAIPKLDHEFQPYPSQLEHLAGVCCECGDYHDERRQPVPNDPFEVRLFNLTVAELLKPAALPFVEMDEWHPDETLIAQRDRAVDALRAVLKRLVNRRDHMFADEQQVLNEADALCVESEGW